MKKGKSFFNWLGYLDARDDIAVYRKDWPQWAKTTYRIGVLRYMAEVNDEEI